MNPSVNEYYYCIDKNDIIIEVSEGWDEFAKSNNGDNLVSGKILGQPLWNYISDPDTQYILKLIVELVRTKNEPISANFRCDSPTLRRYMELSVSLLPDDHVKFTNKILRTEKREPQDWIVNTPTSSKEYVKMCSWCKKVKTPSAWIEAEEALKQLDILRLSEPPQITHGICESCLDFYFSKYKQAQ